MQLVLPNLDEDVHEKLRDLARSHGRTLEEEAREILRRAVADDDATSTGFGTKFSSYFSEVGLDHEIEELRGREVIPPDFGG